MAEEIAWSKETYEASVSSRCWWFTPYDDGWDGCAKHGADISSDAELRDIVAMERALGGVPDRARRVVETAIRSVPPCGHYLFPLAFLEAASAIGTETPPGFMHGCFTVERERKRQMMDYCLCLDAWLAGAPPEAAAAELDALGFRSIDWNGACADLWDVLGERTEAKELLVERLLHVRRHQVKERAWDDDLASEFGRDRYLGTYCEGGERRNPAKVWSHIEAPVPAFDEGASPRVRRLESRLAEVSPDWEWFRTFICRETWLCAPKEFRFMERVLWSIGRGRPDRGLDDHYDQSPEDVPGFLRCEDTCPDQDAAATWWREFLGALRGWWQGRPGRGDAADDVNARLGEATPVKRWLVRLYVHRLEVLARVGGKIRTLVDPRPGSWRGTKPIT